MAEKSGTGSDAGSWDGMGIFEGKGSAGDFSIGYENQKVEGARALKALGERR